MARTTIASSQQVVRTGILPAYAAVDQPNGNQFLNIDQHVFLHIKNGGGTTCTVTIQTPITVDGLAVADLTVAIPTVSERMIGPFPLEYYNQSDGMVYVDYSVGTSVTVAAIRL
jgi:hypothetical protein